MTILTCAAGDWQTTALLVIGCPEIDEGVDIARVCEAIPADFAAQIGPAVAAEHFTGAEGQTFNFHTHRTNGLRRVVLVGLGSDGLGGFACQRFCNAAIDAAKNMNATSLSICFPGTDCATIEQLACYLGVGQYRFDRYRSTLKPTIEIERISIVSGADSSDAQRAIDRGQHIAASVNLARDLTNEPGSAIYPQKLEEIAVQIAAENGLESVIYDQKRIISENMHLLNAVGMGSDHEPRLIHLTYRPEDSEKLPVIALVGKGVTFDSGGLSLKTGKGMEDMKIDMAGAAAVLGAMFRIKELAPRCVVHAVIPSAENMPSARSVRPGDIIRGRNGKSVEILNTDAEGRLILADALTYASELKPDVIIDLATLTGHCVIALGTSIAALFTDDEVLARAIREHGLRQNEDFWRMPLAKRMRAQLDSPVADLKNLGERWGGAITAALFLKEFVHDTRWAHLDIAGTVKAESGDKLHTAGATGFAVRTLISLLSDAGSLA